MISSSLIFTTLKAVLYVLATLFFTEAFECINDISRADKHGTALFGMILIIVCIAWCNHNPNK